ncbi:MULTISPECIES: BTAD domain-containing putative transcriptional regulator [unclassified Aeromicrobium]|uniref:AfsR/SARP family transcriptional regulator n=1 Tax=unclassified Aeromicrobium TaxID=2633570 RepID=UPI00396B171C
MGRPRASRPADQVAVLASRVRRLLGRDTVRHEDGGYRLDGVPTDLAMLRAVVAEAERRSAASDAAGALAAARVALALAHRAPPEPESVADWVVADHAAVIRLVLEARRIGAWALLEAGLWPEALDLAAADRDADPYDEAAVRTLMRAEAAAGRHARALQAYEDLRIRLAEDLGSDPDLRTRALHESLLREGLSASSRGSTTRGWARGT